MGPPDPILGLATQFNEDKNPKKALFGVGAYRDANNKPLVLACVRAAEQAIVSDAKMNKEYLNMAGLPSFVKCSVELMLGPDALSQGNIAAVQTLSGTGGCRLAGDF
ncbi:putative aspartate aminotransferase, partial [Pavlovales sp. CCMP2436]